ncbi:MAG: NAD(P)H-hydrate dehydratase [Blastomonas sp.]
MTRPNDRGKPVVTVAEMVAAEQALFDSGITVDALMARAGEGAAQLIWRIGHRTPTLILCGPGNNGGDGYVIAQSLYRHGVPVTVAANGEPKTDAARNARAAYEGETVDVLDAKPAEQFVDCLFGSGLTRAVGDPLWQQFERLFNGARRRIAIDLPSGVDADGAQPLNAVGRFDHCIALGAWKYAHLLEPAASLMGQLSLVDIGVALSGHAARRLAKPVLSVPDASAHKYSRGLVAMVAGAMPGAIQLSARAAQGAGTGYVRIIGGEPPAGLPADLVWEAGDTSVALADPRISAILIGPGLGRDGAAQALLQNVLASKAPLVLDADALHLLGPCHSALAGRTAPAILTPHAGEFAVLASAYELDGSGNKAEQALALARKSGASVIFKGADSVLASPDGSVTIADRNNGWLSVAGSGDVLAGIVAARLAGHGDAHRAMAEAQWLHDSAARLAGPSFSAGGLAAHVAPALAECL